MLPTRDAERATTRRELDPTDRPSAAERRVRRRRPRESWLRRNALSLAALSALVAVLAVGFALMQVVSHSTPATESPGAATPAAGTTPGTRATVAATAAPASTGAATETVIASAGAREIHSTVKPIDANYTVQSGDSLAAIATRFNTTIQRIQALNNLPNPRVLSIGQKLVVPPPL